MTIFRFPRPSIRSSVLALAAIGLLGASPLSAGASPAAPPVAQQSSAATAALPVCRATVCTFPLRVNPGLQPGKPFACPAIQHAVGTVQVINRFATNRQNDTMIVSVSGLPPNTGFDLFTAQNSPLDAGTFPGFGFAWYQSDLESNAWGRAQVVVNGIFDKETFIQAPFAAGVTPPAPIHTYNVGFWFDSPTTEQHVCGNAKTPGKTPFNGEQNAGLLAMMTQGEPLQTVQ